MMMNTCFLFAHALFHVGEKGLTTYCRSREVLVEFVLIKEELLNEMHGMNSCECREVIMM